MILHADIDAFFASVAQRDDPGLRGRPVIVGSWVVMAASYEARAHGVRSGMATARARRLCPASVLAAPGWPAYIDARDAVFAVLRRSGAAVEPASIDEAFIDAGGLAEPAPALAARLRAEVRDEVGLPLSVGVARTRVLAKIASQRAKPDGLHVVDPAGELAFLHALAVEDVWGIGPATARRLHAAGVHTIGQAAAIGEPTLMAIAGKAAGRTVHAIAHNRDQRPVRERRGRRSFGAQRALRRGPRTRAELEAALAELAERLAKRMERRRRAGRTIVLRLRFGDYARATRSCTLPRPTADAARIAAAAHELLAAAAPLIERRGITLVGLTVTALADEAASGQLSLLEPAEARA